MTDPVAKGEGSFEGMWRWRATVGDVEGHARGRVAGTIGRRPGSTAAHDVEVLRNERDSGKSREEKEGIVSDCSDYWSTGEHRRQGARRN